MPTAQAIKETVNKTIISSIKGFAERSLAKTPKFQILDLIIPKERKIRSIVGGLETSLGTTLWEPLAKELAQMNGFEVIQDKLECPSNMPAALANTVSNLIEDRKGDDPTYTGIDCHNQIKIICRRYIKNPLADFSPPPPGYGVDIWLKKDKTNYLFDTKTVQPNVGTLSKCMEQVINWYSYFYSRYPESKVEGRIVFPYNPNNGGDFWDKAIGKGFPLEKGSEGWVEDEFWDFCSGSSGTFQLIKDCFDEIRTAETLSEELKNMLDQ